jgi:hypothetical protein
VRCVGFIAVFAALLALSASAGEATKKPCLGLEDRTLEHQPRPTEDPTIRTRQPLMTENECEAVKRKGLQLRLIEIPQEQEDPMGLSLGSKDKGGMLYFKIPFSF